MSQTPVSAQQQSVFANVTPIVINGQTVYLAQVSNDTSFQQPQPQQEQQLQPIQSRHQPTTLHQHLQQQQAGSLTLSSTAAMPGGEDTVIMSVTSTSLNSAVIPFPASAMMQITAPSVIGNNPSDNNNNNMIIRSFSGGLNMTQKPNNINNNNNNNNNNNINMVSSSLSGVNMTHKSNNNNSVISPENMPPKLFKQDITQTVLASENTNLSNYIHKVGPAVQFACVFYIIIRLCYYNIVYTLVINYIY